jgi:hypothetical protein
VRWMRTGAENLSANFTTLPNRALVPHRTSPATQGYRYALDAHSRVGLSQRRDHGRPPRLSQLAHRCGDCVERIIRLV